MGRLLCSTTKSTHKERKKTMNIDKAIERIAANNTADAISEWSENIAARRERLHEQVHSILGKVCDNCPFRNNLKMGGCISTACPVHKVTDAVNAISDKAREIAKKARNRKYKIDAENWKKERGL